MANEKDKQDQQPVGLDIAGLIERLAALRDRGEISNDEFELQKRRVLGTSPIEPSAMAASELAGLGVAGVSKRKPAARSNASGTRILLLMLAIGLVGLGAYALWGQGRLASMFSPGGVCASADTQTQVKDILFTAAAELSSGDSSPATTDAIKKLVPVSLDDIRFDGRDPQTGKISCSANMTVSDQETLSAPVQYSRQPMATGHGDYIYVTDAVHPAMAIIGAMAQSMAAMRASSQTPESSQAKSAATLTSDAGPTAPPAESAALVDSSASPTSPPVAAPPDSSN